MSWLDLAIIILFAGIILAEIKRGFGKALFDLAAMLVAVRGAPMIAEPLSRSLHLAEKQTTNEAAVYAAVFVVIGGILLFLGKLLYDTTLISADTFDPLLGGVLGIGIAVIACHALVRTLALSAGPDALPPVIVNSGLAGELLNFESYHHLVDVLYNFNRTE